MKRTASLILAATISSSALLAQPRPGDPPDVFSRVTACLNVANSGERLTCFDREVAALAQAQASQQVVVMDQAQIRQTRRGLFGLTLPNLGGMFNHEEGPREIAAKLSGVSSSAGQWVFTLDDGSVWRTTESRSFAREPRAGMDIRIRRAAMGSYMANIGEQRAIRVSRIR